MGPQEIKSKLNELVAELNATTGENFEAGFFVLLNKEGLTTALALGSPHEISMIITSAMIDLMEKEPTFKLVLMATALTLINQMIQENESAYPFIRTQIEDMRALRGMNETRAAEATAEALAKAAKTSH